MSLHLQGAGDYLIPAIELQPIEVKRLGKYGRIRRAFLQEYNPMLFDDLVLTEQLFPHLYEVQEIAEKRVEVIMKGLLEKNPASDKEKDAMAWGQAYEYAESNGGGSSG